MDQPHGILAIVGILLLICPEIEGILFGPSGQTQVLCHPVKLAPFVYDSGQISQMASREFAELYAIKAWDKGLVNHISHRIPYQLIFQFIKCSEMTLDAYACHAPAVAVIACVMAVYLWSI